jgi:eukaryotic-like serine/threonine-protein kinase
MDAIRAGGCRLGRYELRALVASEETGNLYRAWDTRLNRAVALKIVADAVAQDAARVARFFEHAQTTALIAHPNIASVFAVGVDRGRPFVVSELLQGESLRARLRGQRLPVPMAASYALEIAHGLIAAHEVGVVHGGLSPEHVFVTVDGCVKIADFGLPVGPAAALSAAAYLSPEQARDGAGDERSDIFSVGVILYEMIAAARPFSGATAIEACREILASDPAPLPEDVDISPELQHVVAHCLEKEPAQRFQSARDLAFVLEFTLRGPQPARQPAPRRRGLASVLQRF